MVYAIAVAVLLFDLGPHLALLQSKPGQFGTAHDDSSVMQYVTFARVLCLKCEVET
jgi:hypothetical protein